LYPLPEGYKEKLNSLRDKFKKLNKDITNPDLVLGLLSDADKKVKLFLDSGSNCLIRVMEVLKKVVLMI